MKNIGRLLVLVMVVLLLCPHESRADNRKIYTRGWIGGSYLGAEDCGWAQTVLPEGSMGTRAIWVLPEKIKAEYGGAVFVARVFANTPAANGGLNEGELILRINDSKVPDLKTFFKIVDAAEPGSSLQLTGFRDGEIVHHTLVVGRERYKKIGLLELFFGFDTNLDLIPNPDFSIFSLIAFKRNNTRLDLDSPSMKYYRDNLKSDAAKERYLLQRSEGWDFRVFPFGIGRSIVVVDQNVL